MRSKAYLENKLKSVKKEILWNTVITILAIIFILVIPPTSFDVTKFRIEVHLEWIVAFIIMIVGIVRVFTLSWKRKELEEDLSFYDKKDKYKLKWRCDFCGKKFRTKKEAERHEKHCKKQK